MKLEHFWYGLTNGDGYVFKRSPKALQLLKEKTLERLKQLPADPAPVFMWLPTEQIVTVSKVEKASDNTGRAGVINHTLLIPIKTYVALSSPLFETQIVFPHGIPEKNVLEP